MNQAATESALPESSAQAAVAASSVTDGRTLPLWAVTCAVLGGLFLFHAVLHYALHGVFNVHQLVLAFFLVLNILINFWELGLHRQGDAIRAEYLAHKDQYRGRPMDYVNSVFLRRIPVNQLHHFKHWTGIWSGYCFFDQGYSRRGSLGFNLDVGNGYSTLLPALLFGLGMSIPLVSPTALGIIGVVIFWQMFYGTALYFFQYFHAGRHKGHTKRDLFLFVFCTNGFWFIFPIWGMLVSIWMIYNESYDILTSNTASLFGQLLG